MPSMASGLRRQTMRGADLPPPPADLLPTRTGCGRMLLVLEAAHAAASAVSAVATATASSAVEGQAPAKEAPWSGRRSVQRQARTQRCSSQRRRQRATRPTKLRLMIVDSWCSTSSCCWSWRSAWRAVHS